MEQGRKGLRVLRNKRLSSRTYSSQVLDRVVGILGSFTTERPELRLAELATVTRLHKSTLYRLLEAMRHHHLVSFDEGSGAYRLGIRLFELGSIAIGGLEFDKYARPALEDLARTTGETAHLCVLDGTDIVYVAKVESSSSLRMSSSVGGRNPAYCTGVGKAILANLPSEQLSVYLGETEFQPFTRKTIVSKEKLRAQLREVVAQGYAIDDEERHEGVRCVAAPVRDYTGTAVAGISIAGPSSRVSKERIAALAEQVTRVAEAISSRLGHRPKRETAARNTRTR
jgi:IclR family transcriptional regulator, KDG regulon repressor